MLTLLTSKIFGSAFKLKPTNDVRERALEKLPGRFTIKLDVYKMIENRGRLHNQNHRNHVFSFFQQKK